MAARVDEELVWQCEAFHVPCRGGVLSEDPQREDDCSQVLQVPCRGDFAFGGLAEDVEQNEVVAIFARGRRP